MSADYLISVVDNATRVMPLNEIHASAAINRLAALKHTLTSDVNNSLGLRELVRQTARIVERGEVGGWELANILLGVATLRKDVPWMPPKLTPAILDMIPRRAATMTPQALSNALWSIGQLGLPKGQADEAVEALQSVCLSTIGKFTLFDAAQMAWGLADHGSIMPELGAALTAYVTKQAPRVPIQSAVLDLPQVAMACGKLGLWDAGMLGEIAFRLGPWISKLRLWGLAALLWTWQQPGLPSLRNSEWVRDDELVCFRGPLQNRPRSYVVKNFRRILDEQASLRGVLQENIDRSVQGAKLN